MLCTNFVPLQTDENNRQCPCTVLTYLYNQTPTDTYLPPTRRAYYRSTPDYTNVLFSASRKIWKIIEK